jgi:hypothetical protein
VDIPLVWHYPAALTLDLKRLANASITVRTWKKIMPNMDQVQAPADRPSSQAPPSELSFALIASQSGAANDKASPVAGQKTLVADSSATAANGGACSSDNAKDPFSLNVHFGNDASVVQDHRGLCVDTSQKRPIHVLSPQEVSDLHMAPAAPGETVVANFSYNNKFYIARFPADGVSDIIAQKELFNPGIPGADQLNGVLGYSAHFQQRFEFNKPGKEVVLVPQDDPTNTSKAIKIHNVVSSDEAVAKEGGEPFDVVKGLEGHYAYVRTFDDLKERYNDMVVKENNKVEQWQIKPVVNKNEKIDGKTPTPDLVRQEYFKSALNLSNTDYETYKRTGTAIMYNTLQRSCVTGGFEIYDRVNHYNNPIQPEMENLKRNPLFIRQMLLSRGLLTQQEFLLFTHKTPDLKTEVQSTHPFPW